MKLNIKEDCLAINPFALNAEQLEFYKPTKNKAGEIFIGGHLFRDAEDVIQQALEIIDSKNYDTIIRHNYAKTWFLGLVYQIVKPKFLKYHSRINGIVHIDREFTPYGEKYLTVEIDGSQLEEPPSYDCWKHNLTEYLNDDSNYLQTSKSTDLDSRRLAVACPEVTLFNTNYPLNKLQAKVIQTILGNINLIDLDLLFSNLMPSYIQSMGVTYERRSANKEETEEEMFDTALKDQEHIDKLLSDTSSLTVLPTLKEAMSVSFTQENG